LIINSGAFCQPETPVPGLRDAPLQQPQVKSRSWGTSSEAKGNVMNTASRLLLVCAAGLMGQPAMAATVSADFNASVTLTSVCRVKSGFNNLTLDFGTYTAFQVSAQPATGIDIDFECTRGFGAAPTVEFDTGTDRTSSAAGATATGAGVVSGLNYTMAVAAGVNTAGTAATTASIGTPDTYRFAVSGSMPSGQAGTSTTGVQTQSRQLTITY